MLTVAPRAEAAALPGLEVLLDAARLDDWLAGQGLPAADRRRYLRYKPGTSAVLGLVLAGRPAFLLAVTEDGAPKLAKYHRRPGGTGVLAHDVGRRLLLARPSADRDLPATARLSELTAAAAADWRCLAYKPMRRWVGSTDAGPAGAPVVLRAYRPGGAVDARARYTAVHRAGAPTPAVLALHERRSALVVEHLPGRPATTADLPAVGRALAALHALPVVDATPPAAALTWTDSVEQVARLRPDRSADLRRLRVIAAESDRAVAAPALCHGDFSLDQVVVDARGGVGILDLDRAGAGDPALDLASAISELDDDGAAALLAGYHGHAEVGDLRRPVLRAVLSRLAEPLRTCDPQWSDAVDARIARAERIAGLRL